jgi:hypothetical protein
LPASKSRKRTHQRVVSGYRQHFRILEQSGKKGFPLAAARVAWATIAK